MSVLIRDECDWLLRGDSSMNENGYAWVQEWMSCEHDWIWGTNETLLMDSNFMALMGLKMSVISQLNEN